MFVQLKMVLATDPAAAWRALRSPTVMRELYAPLLDIGAESTATRWGATSAEVPVRLAGLVPIGRQLIDLEYDEERRPGVKIMRDTGGPRSGPLALLRGWNHRMAISPADGHPGLTLLRDRLTFHGPAAAAYWYPLWAMWQWRGSRLRDMAPSWAFDPQLVPPDATDESDAATGS
ncbi:hypothetical protein SAMN04489806_1990 [Paramicrobacterium humi]|uniref:Polyketide cyclase / dehydrase and lipid transport n=1 Tax=Paramicrobacterium humi TaxID=640635 RepID=A0A1H4MWB3_9MICO|nr:hypothetical protein [Microbacterium humi]SEB86805.1 hypothetical protein SAMN04489806_1990 [Microbacterium humi]